MLVMYRNVDLINTIYLKGNKVNIPRLLLVRKFYYQRSGNASSELYDGITRHGKSYLFLLNMKGGSNAILDISVEVY